MAIKVKTCLKIKQREGTMKGSELCFEMNNGGYESEQRSCCGYTMGWRTKKSEFDSWKAEEI
jgi:hypothetical protein